MIFFSVVELINKFLGLYITGYLARILAPSELGIYLSALVTLGYAVEVGFFGSQNRHNAEFAVDPNYLGSPHFAARKTLTTGCSLVAAALLMLALPAAHDHFRIVPLLGVLACVPITFDYVAYGSKKSSLVVVARLCSQLVAVCWVYAVAHGMTSTHELFWGQCFQTVTLTLVILAGVLWLRLLPARAVGIGVVRFPATGADLRTAVRDQSTAFSLRALALVLVSGELVLLGVLGNALSGELATSLRLVQVIFPFVVFYVDSSVVNVTSAALSNYVRAIFLSAVALLVASPAIIVVLFGRSYASCVLRIDAFLPAFMIQALLQYSIMLSLKERSERELLLRLLLPVAVAAVGVGITLARGPTLIAVAVIYAIKALIFVAVVPRLSIKLRLIGALLVIAIVVMNPILDHVGYYDAVTDLMIRLHPG